MGHDVRPRLHMGADGGYGRRLFYIPIIELTHDLYVEGEPNILADKIGWRQSGLHHTYNRIWSDQHLIETVDRHYNTVKRPVQFLSAAIWYIVDGIKYLTRRKNLS